MKNVSDRRFIVREQARIRGFRHRLLRRYFPYQSNETANDNNVPSTSLEEPAVNDTINEKNNGYREQGSDITSANSESNGSISEDWSDESDDSLSSSTLSNKRKVSTIPPKKTNCNHTECQGTKSPIDMDIDREEDIPTLIRKIYYSLKAEIQIMQKQNMNGSLALQQGQTEIERVPTTFDHSTLLLNPVLDFGLRFPCETMEEFNKLEEKLAQRQHFEAMKRDISRHLDKKISKTRNLAEIFRKYMAKSVAEKFSPFKETKGKRPFAKTRLFACMRVSIIESFPADNIPSEVQVRDWIKGVLYNVRDWNGHRAKRTKK